MVWNLNANITLDHIPDLFSFIIVRKEYFGGYLYNPFLYEPIILNKKGIFILELCNGCYMVSDIINLTADKFSYPKDFTKKLFEVHYKNLINTSHLGGLERSYLSLKTIIKHY